MTAIICLGKMPYEKIKMMPAIDNAEKRTRFAAGMLKKISSRLKIEISGSAGNLFILRYRDLIDHRKNPANRAQTKIRKAKRIILFRAGISPAFLK